MVREGESDNFNLCRDSFPPRLAEQLQLLQAQHPQQAPYDVVLARPPEASALGPLKSFLLSQARAKFIVVCLAPGAKAELPLLIRMLGRWGFSLVENLVWWRKRVNHEPFLRALLPGEIFLSERDTYYIFRNAEDVEMRHQRSPDVFWDFAPDPEHLGAGNRFQTPPVPERVYKTIETMLPRARFLELWASEALRNPRKGWTAIAEI